MSHTYLLINLGAIAIPLIFSFHPRLRFDRYFGPALAGIAGAALIFIPWDVWFTEMGVWWFNDDYIMGVDIFGLPIEEWMFFICIPFACLFTYHCLGVLLPRNLLARPSRPVSAILSLGCLAIGLLHYDQWYTTVTFTALALVIVFTEWGLRPAWLTQFYISYLILIIPFFVVNGLLTGTGLREAVVSYNDAENLGIRLLTIPVEDVFYGMLLILLNVIILETLRRPGKGPGVPEHLQA